MKHTYVSLCQALASSSLAARGLLLLAGLALAAPAAGQGTVVPGPPASVSFGTKITVLPNGNFVVADPGYSNNLGAVYLFRGTDGVRLGMLTGARSGDQIGSGGLLVVGDGNFVVCSPEFGGGGQANKGLGAVTWMGGTTGFTATVGPNNSLVGSTAADGVGTIGTGVLGVQVLPNGNYLVRSPYWHNSAGAGVGAVTWGSGAAGVSGAVSSTNSLVGQYNGDGVGGDNLNTPGIAVLTNSNYVVVVANYHTVINTSPQSYGAVAWGSGTAGLKGILSASNALVGNTVGDGVGSDGITVLPGGNYLVKTPNWTNGNMAGAGAVTWGSGTAGVKGSISASNSLVGNLARFNVGTDGTVLVLANGNYLVVTRSWTPNTQGDSYGAVTWGSSATGVKGTISSNNSLVGSAPGDGLGFDGANTSVYPQPNGSYVVYSPYWDNRMGTAVADAGALTLGDANGNTVGPITGCNSIVGSVASKGNTISYTYNSITNTILGGLPAENRVVIGIGAPAAPTGAGAQTYNPGATVADLKATGTAVRWYATPAGGAALDPTTPLADGTTYYGTQTVGSCESQSRLAVKAAAPLPVGLTGFTATQASPATVRLAWGTASEKNSAAFEVERSADGGSFARIGTVAAAGTSSVPRSYELPDAQLPPGPATLYYRLRQVDQDGTAAYSPVRTVALAGATSLALYPNPATTGATLTGTAPGATMTILDALGRPVATATASAQGTATLALPPGLAPGVYVVRVGTQAVRLTVE